MPPIRTRTPFLAALLVLCGTAPLCAQQTPEAAAVTALAAAYQLANADGDRTCALTLKPDPLKPDASGQS